MSDRAETGAVAEDVGEMDAEDATERDADGSDSLASRRPQHLERGPDAALSGRQGWLLVVVLVATLLVVPWALIALPSIQQSIATVGLSLRDAYLVVPLGPAFLLGAIGVWIALRDGDDES